MNQNNHNETEMNIVGNKELELAKEILGKEDSLFEPGVYKAIEIYSKYQSEQEANELIASQFRGFLKQIQLVEELCQKFELLDVTSFFKERIKDELIKNYQPINNPLYLINNVKVPEIFKIWLEKQDHFYLDLLKQLYEKYPNCDLLRLIFRKMQGLSQIPKPEQKTAIKKANRVRLQDLKQLLTAEFFLFDEVLEQFVTKYTNIPEEYLYILLFLKPFRVDRKNHGYIKRILYALEEKLLKKNLTFEQFCTLYSIGNSDFDGEYPYELCHLLFTPNIGDVSVAKTVKKFYDIVRAKSNLILARHLSRPCIIDKLVSYCFVNYSKSLRTIQVNEAYRIHIELLCLISTMNPIDGIVFVEEFIKLKNILFDLHVNNTLADLLEWNFIPKQLLNKLDYLLVSKITLAYLDAHLLNSKPYHSAMVSELPILNCIIERIGYLHPPLRRMALNILFKALQTIDDEMLQNMLFSSKKIYLSIIRFYGMGLVKPVIDFICDHIHNMDLYLLDFIHLKIITSTLPPFHPFAILNVIRFSEKYLEKTLKDNFYISQNKNHLNLTLEFFKTIQLEENYIQSTLQSDYYLALNYLIKDICSKFPNFFKNAFFL